MTVCGTGWKTDNHKAFMWRGALMFSFICVWIKDWVNNGEAGDLRRYCIHYDVTVMYLTLDNLLWCPLVTMFHKYMFVHITIADPLQWCFVGDMIFNHRQRDCLFISLFLIASEKTSKFPTTGQLWGYSISDWSILLTKGPLCGNVSMSWSHFANSSNLFIAESLNWYISPDIHKMQWYKSLICWVSHLIQLSFFRRSYMWSTHCHILILVTHINFYFQRSKTIYGRFFFCFFLVLLNMSGFWVFFLVLLNIS